MTVVISISLLLRAWVAVLVVLCLKLVFRPQPVIQIAAMNSDALDVNLKRAFTDFRWRWSVLVTSFKA